MSPAGLQLHWNPSVGSNTSEGMDLLARVRPSRQRAKAPSFHALCTDCQRMVWPGGGSSHLKRSGLKVSSSLRTGLEVDLTTSMTQLSRSPFTGVPSLLGFELVPDVVNWQPKPPSQRTECSCLGSWGSWSCEHFLRPFLFPKLTLRMWGPTWRCHIFRLYFLFLSIFFLLSDSIIPMILSSHMLVLFPPDYSKLPLKASCVIFSWVFVWYWWLIPGASGIRFPTSCWRFQIFQVPKHTVSFFIIPTSFFLPSFCCCSLLP